MADYQTEELVLFFCDAHDFSKAMVELGGRYPDFIQTYYEQVGEAVVSRGGELVKYIGDAIFATFPAGCEEDAREPGASPRSRRRRLRRSR